MGVWRVDSPILGIIKTVQLSFCLGWQKRQKELQVLTVFWSAMQIPPPINMMSLGNFVGWEHGPRGRAPQPVTQGQSSLFWFLRSSVASPPAVLSLLTFQPLPSLAGCSFKGPPPSTWRADSLPWERFILQSPAHTTLPLNALS